MLSASRIYKSGLTHAIKPMRSTRVAVIKRCESTAATTATKKSGSFGKVLLTATVLGGAAYGGATFYALHDSTFREVYITYNPAGQQTLDFLEDVQKGDRLNEYRDQAANAKKQVEYYTSLAKDYSSKAKDALDNASSYASGAYAYATDAYQKLSGQKEPPKLKDVPEAPSSQSPTTTLVLKTDDKKPGEISVTSDKEATAPAVEVAIEKPKPIVVKALKSDNPVVQELSTMIVELATILNEAGLASQGRALIQDAERELAELNARYQQWSDEQTAILKSVVQLKQKSDAIEEQLNTFREDAKLAMQSSHTKTLEKIQAREAQLQQEFANARKEMNQTFNQLLANELEAQKAQLQHERSEALLQQSAEMQRRFMRDVKLLVEIERAGRLSKLEQVSARFNALEQQSLQNANDLDKSRQSHLTHITLSALQEAVQAAHKQPFAEELSALQKCAGTNAVVKAVLSTIPREVAEEGVESLANLHARFDTVADEVRRVALVPENGGFGAHIISMILANFMFKKEGLVEGDDVEAILARSSYYLQNGNLETAARELNQLSGWPKRLASDWIEAARRHLEIKQALEVVETQAILNSLLEA